MPQPKWGAASCQTNGDLPSGGLQNKCGASWVDGGWGALGFSDSLEKSPAVPASGAVEGLGRGKPCSTHQTASPEPCCLRPGLLLPSGGHGHQPSDRGLLEPRPRPPLGRRPACCISFSSCSCEPWARGDGFLCATIPGNFKCKFVLAEGTFLRKWSVSFSGTGARG